MAPIDSTSSVTASLGNEPLTPPPGVKLDTPEKEGMFRSALEFERFFVQKMLEPMQKAGQMLGGDEDGGEGSAGMSGYQDMAQDQMTQAVLNGGGLGLASTLYGQMAQAAGLDVAKPAASTAAPTGATAAPTTSAAAPAAPTAGGGAA